MLEEIEENDEQININNQNKYRMEEDKIILDYIDQYHAGEILEEDFQERLKLDVNLQQAFVRHQQDLKVIQAGAKEQLKKKAALALELHEQKKGKIFPLKRLLQIAATVTLLVVSTFLLKDINRSSSTPDLYTAHFVLPDAAGERSGSTQSDAWNDAMTAYSNQDFEMTIELLIPLLNQKDFQYADRGHLYLGLSQLMQNESQSAIKNFETINRESSFVQDAEWYQSLAYLKINNLEKAKETLKKIVDQPRHFKHKEAKTILESLE